MINPKWHDRQASCLTSRANLLRCRASSHGLDPSTSTELAESVDICQVVNNTFTNPLTREVLNRKGRIYILKKIRVTLLAMVIKEDKIVEQQGETLSKRVGKKLLILEQSRCTRDKLRERIGNDSLYDLKKIIVYN